MKELKSTKRYSEKIIDVSTYSDFYCSFYLNTNREYNHFKIWKEEIDVSTYSAKKLLGNVLLSAYFNILKI